MKRSRSVQRALDTLRGGLTRDPAGLRRYALTLVGELAEANIALWFEVGMVEGEPVPVRWRMPGADPDLLYRQAQALPYPNGDPRLPNPRLLRRFVPLRSVIKDVERDFYASRLYETVWRHASIEDQVRMTVHHEGRFIAFIGAYRRLHEPLFQRADVSRVNQLADALADALITADRVERVSDPEEACDLLLTPQGQVEFASASCKALLSMPGIQDAFVDWARRADMRRGPLGEVTEVPRVIEGYHVRWSRLEGDSGARYLLHLERPEPMKLHPGFVLSRTQRVIAKLATAGASAPEIAQMLNCSAETVRTHLRQAYRLLHVSSRAELAQVVADMPEDGWEVPQRPRAGASAA